MKVMGYSLFLDAVEARPRVTSISVHLHIENTTDTVIPLPQTDIVGVPIGTPHFVTGHCSVRDSQHRQAPLQYRLSRYIPPGPENRNSFVGSPHSPHQFPIS